MENIFFFDIDGTLIDHSKDLHVISPKVFNALKKLQMNNILFIATGRAKCLLPKDIIDFGFDGYLLENGCYAEYKGKKILENNFNYDDLLFVAEYCDKNDAIYYYETNDRIFTNGINKKLHIRFNDSWDIPDIYTAEMFTPSDRVGVGMLAFEDYISLKRGLADLSYFDLREHLGLFPSVDLCLHGSNKGTAINKILNILNIAKNNSYCFGDGLNDLEMMNSVGHSFAMGNASEQVKKIADEVCLPAEEDGVYYALLKHGFI